MTSQSIMHQDDSESEFEYLNASFVEKSTPTSGNKSFYYPSNVAGKFIKNAVTGVEYPWRVGSLDALRLFKVVDTVGNYDSNGCKIKVKSKDYPNPNPNQCYYDSPQQCMTHRKMSFQPELIERWQKVQESFKLRDE
jgi:hypothetical protein